MKLTKLSALTIGCLALLVCWNTFAFSVISRCRPVKLDTRYRTEKKSVRLLFDCAHSHAVPPGAGLDKVHYDYYEFSNWDRLLREMNRIGASTDILRQGPITRELLEQYELLCLYYPSADGQMLSCDEIRAIERWTRAGGGLFVVGEHSNADGSAAILNPLLRKFGLRIPYATLVDIENTFAFGGWDKQVVFSKHPITENLQEIALISSGAVEVDSHHPDRPRGLSQSSEKAFLDGWNPRNRLGGFVGDFTPGENEPRGSFFGLAAATPGRGRVVVMADHNALSNIFLHYVDNFRLGLQAWSWLSRGRIEIPPKEQPAPRYSILIPETTKPSNIMTPQSFREGMATSSYFTFFVALSRESRTLVRCTSRLGEMYDALIIMPQKEKFTSGFLDYVGEARRNGALIVIVVDGSLQPAEGTRQLLRKLGLDLGDPGPLKLDEVRLFVGGHPVGRATVRYHDWSTTSGETIVHLEERQGKKVPVVVSPLPHVQIFLQASLIRNDSFQTARGRVLGTGPLKPNQDGLVVYETLWAWLDELISSKFMKPGPVYPNR